LFWKKRKRGRSPGFITGNLISLYQEDPRSQKRDPPRHAGAGRGTLRVFPGVKWEGRFRFPGALSMASRGKLFEFRYQAQVGQAVDEELHG
jgi:hypothetical protein